MPSLYRYVIARAALTAILSLVASFCISYAVVPLLGGRLEGAGLIMTLVLPVVIAFPASAVHFWQFETTRRLKNELCRALTEIDEVNSRLVKVNLELVRERSHDPLTRLLTQDVFDQRLQDQPDQPDIGQLVKLRVDGIAALRRQYGGTVADAAIFAAAAAIRRALRPVDFAGRVGDHEFAIFMPGSTPILASLAVSSVSKAVELVHLPFDGNGHLPTTVSAGGVECAPGFAIEAAWAAVDTELERSTSQGGNCSHWGNLRSAAMPRTSR